MGEICGDNRFEVIADYKKRLIEGTNIEQSPDEMAVIDNIVFRFWQMGWLDTHRSRADLISKREVLEEINNTNASGGFADYSDYCNLFDFVDTMPSAQPWIPVIDPETKKERLPEEREWVLVFIREGIKAFIAVSMRTDYNFWSGLGRKRNITHWMPLPEPPKEKENEQ